MPIDREMGLPGLPVPLGDHDWVAVLDDIHDLDSHSEGLHAVAQPAGVAQAVVAALGEGADRGYTELFHEIGEVGVAGRSRLGQRLLPTNVRRLHTRSIL